MCVFFCPYLWIFFGTPFFACLCFWTLNSKKNMWCQKKSVGLTEGGESHNGDDDSSDSEGDEPSLSQEPKTPRNPSTGGGSQPGSTVHRPRGTQLFL